MHRERSLDRAPGKQSSTESLGVPLFEPGKRTRTEGLVVQRRETDTAAGASLAATAMAASAPAPLAARTRSGQLPALQMLFGVQRAGTAVPAEDTAAIHAAATRGTATPATKLPYADQIQRAFGHHDISGIQAHVGRDAAAATRDMGARAYATGDHVVLGDGADLHTVAHEAAHVVQQRRGIHLAGGVGGHDDLYERHADAVADRVVRGESAAALLDEHAGTGAGNGAVQRKFEINAPAGQDYDALLALYKVLTNSLDRPEAEALQNAVGSKHLTLVLAWRDSDVEDDEMGSTYPADNGQSLYVTIDRSLNWLTTEMPEAQAQATETILHEFILHAKPLIQRLLAGSWQRGGPNTEDTEHGDFAGWSKVLGAAGKIGSPVVYHALIDTVSHVDKIGADKSETQKKQLQALFLSLLPGLAKPHGLDVVKASDDLVFVVDLQRNLVTALQKDNTGWLEPKGDEASLQLWNQHNSPPTMTSQPVTNNSTAPTTTIPGNQGTGQQPLLHPGMQRHFHHGGTMTRNDDSPLYRDNRPRDGSDINY